jgi:hypothetical protein
MLTNTEKLQIASEVIGILKANQLTDAQIETILISNFKIDLRNLNILNSLTQIANLFEKYHLSLAESNVIFCECRELVLRKTTHPHAEADC